MQYQHDRMLSFVRLHCPLPRSCNLPHRFLCSARLTHHIVPPAISSKHKFLVLSDLHVKRDTLQTCLQALQIAHDHALERDAAVLFLGDFWHARGNLPVEPLNAILTHLASWKVPLLMIPGNHDLVSRSGTNVSLVPLATTLSERCMLITAPTVCLDALFLPYMHDLAALKDTLKEVARLPQPIRAVFCHVEVAGARLADRFVSPESPRSVKPSDFPPSLRVYSGHIHRPHTVSDTITYVGSPYQVSASEQGQQKSLLVLDRNDGWQVVDRIPIDIGPRHFTLSPDAPFSIPDLRHGDRVILHTSTDHPDLVHKLREQGVRVQVQPTSNGTLSSASQDSPLAPVEPRITTGTLTSEDLFRKYGTIKTLGGAVTQAGIEILRQIGGRASSASGKDVTIQWDSVTLKGFGSFLENVRYPLSRRGLVLVTGQDCDADGTMTGRTNATGKTTLVMAALWAMTGRTDPRPDGSVEKGVSLEMVHDDAKECEVIVRVHLGGVRVLSEVFDMMSPEERIQARIVDINGFPINELLDVVVSRTSSRVGSPAKTRSYKQGLCLKVNDIDVSCLDVKETQNRLDRLVESSLLPHTVFFGQHMGAGRGLLDSTDRTLKDHLSLIFPLDIWKEARKVGRAKLSKLQETHVISDAAIEAAKAVVTRLEAAEDVARQQWALFEDERDRKLAHIDGKVADMIARESHCEEDSVVFSESFAISNCSDDLTPMIEDLKSYANNLDFDEGTNLDLSCASAAAEMAKTEMLLQADRELHERASSLAGRALEWAKSRDEKLSEIQHYLAGLQKELDEMKTSGDIDAAWKAAVGSLNACDERLQDLVVVNFRDKEHVVSDEFAKQVLTIESTRKSAEISRAEIVKLETSLHEIRHRLMQSEEFSLFSTGSVKEEVAPTPVISLSSAITCEKCLRPFDGVLFEEARSKLEDEAQVLESNIRIANENRKRCINEHDEAVQALNDRVQAQKSMIVQEKQKLTQNLGSIRAVRNQRTALVNEIDRYSEKAEKLEREENIYLRELVSFNIVDKWRNDDMSKMFDKVTAEMDKRTAHSEKAMNEARRNHEKVIFDIENRERVRRNLQCEKDMIFERVESIQHLRTKLKHTEIERDSIREEGNPYEESLRMLTEELAKERATVRNLDEEHRQISGNIAVMKAIDVAFGPRGVPSFVLEEGLTRLEKLAEEYLHELSAGQLMLQLRGFSDYKSSSKSDGENKEVISKRIFARKPDSTELRERTLRQLSGGQRRRCSLSFALAFAELAHERAGFRSSMIVLDEIMQSLDEDGRVRLAKIIPRLLEETDGFRDSIFVVTQDEVAEIAGRAHGGIDIVQRKLDRSVVCLDGQVQE